MIVTMTATDKLTYLDGVAVRVWEGKTEKGIPCFVFVHRIAVSTEQDNSQFERELAETIPESAN